MKVRFKKTDPRGGTVVELPDERAQEEIDAGNATKVSDDTETNGYGGAAGDETGTDNPTGRRADSGAKADTGARTATKDASTAKGTSNKSAGGTDSGEQK